MLNLIAWILLSVAGVYSSIGLVFALVFVVRGVSRIDPAAVDGSIGFRILIVPGVVAFWPVLMRRHLNRMSPPEERNAHRILAGPAKGGLD